LKRKITRMVEYTRLISGDWFQRLTKNWQPRDTVILVAVLAGVVVIGWLFTKWR